MRKRGLSYYRNLRKLAEKRFNTPQDYFELQIFQGQDILNHISDHKISIGGKNILEVGCSYGGISLPFTKKGAKVTAIDINKKAIEFAKKRKLKGISYIQMNAEKTRFKDDCFDGIIASNVVEHVENPAKFLMELHRIVKEGGFVYLSFPPWCSPAGGHNIKPFHLIPEKILRPLSRLAGKEKKVDDQLAELNKMSVNKAIRLINDAGFSIVSIHEKFLPTQLFAKIPGIREFISLNIEFILKRCG